MLECIITGGQTGADLGAWRAAKTAGIPTGGAMPARFLTEAGPRPEFAERYGAHPLETADYPARTAANASEADGTLWFGSPHTTGYRCTADAAWPEPFRTMTSDGLGPPAVAICTRLP